MYEPSAAELVTLFTKELIVSINMFLFLLNEFNVPGIFNNKLALLFALSIIVPPFKFKNLQSYTIIYL